MNKFKQNYKKKQYEKEINLINQQFKGKNTTREILLRKLKTSQEYEEAIERFYTSNNSNKPAGLKLYIIEDKILLEKAFEQVSNITFDYNSNLLEINEKMTNYRFYINTPYFDRNGTDPYPLFRFDDIKINYISQLVLKSLNILGITEFDLNLLNIIVRIYKSGDILNFHTDREIFGENIYGLVLYNSNQSRGLVLKNKSQSFMLDEKEGLIWNLSGESRWDFSHGYSTYFNDSNIDKKFIRISISFRFFNNLKQIPNKPYEILL